jgi:hypothetical protein
MLPIGQKSATKGENHGSRKGKNARKGRIMAAEKAKTRDLQEIREVKPTVKGRNLIEGQDFSSLKAMLVKTEKQKEAKKK